MSETTSSRSNKTSSDANNEPDLNNASPNNKAAIHTSTQPPGSRGSPQHTEGRNESLSESLAALPQAGYEDPEHPLNRWLRDEHGPFAYGFMERKEFTPAVEIDMEDFMSLSSELGHSDDTSFG
jgi:hypothetical protein